MHGSIQYPKLHRLSGLPVCTVRGGNYDDLISLVNEVHKLFAKEDCQRPKEREQANFEQGLYGGWFDHGGGGEN